MLSLRLCVGRAAQQMKIVVESVNATVIVDYPAQIHVTMCFGLKLSTIIEFEIIGLKLSKFRLEKILHMFTLKISLGVLANCKRITTINCHYIL